jgi:glycerol-3-phosphate acyltransferase PlsY
MTGVLAGGLAAVIGHLYPVWLRFKGGKGVATGFGVLIAASPAVGLLAGAAWIGVAAWLRYSSLAALSSFALAPLIGAVVGAAPEVTALAAVTAVLVWLRHGANIRRLVSGTEPRIGDKR